MINLSLDYKDENTFTVKVQGPKGYWIGLGFGDVMKNSDMHLIQFKDENHYVLVDTYSLGHKTPTEDVKLGGTDDLKNVKYTSSNDTLTITYERLFNTNDKYDAVLVPNRSYRIMTTYGSLPVSYHGGGHYEFFDVKIERPKIDI